MVRSLPDEMARDYRQLTGHAGIVDLSGQTCLELRGRDRRQFLQNLSTNQIVELPVGRGCEAFITNVQGRTIGYVHVVCLPDALRLLTAPGQAEVLLAHLDRYLIREDVVLEDASQRLGMWLVAGPAAGELLREATASEPPSELGTTRMLDATSGQLCVHHVDWTGPVGYLVSGPSAEARQLIERLRSHGAADCGPAAADVARIEQGTPRFGVDVTAENLPQEVARDERAISFRKGCYLGQETVARIDALGHVNKTLVGVRFAGEEVPPRGAELVAGDRVVGKVTSAAWSPQFAAPLALAYVRRGSNAPGTRLASAAGPAEVVRLPARQ